MQDYFDNETLTSSVLNAWSRENVLCMSESVRTLPLMQQFLWRIVFHAKSNCHYQELSSHRRKKMDHDYLNYRSILIPIEVRQYAHSWVTNSPLFFFIFIFIVCVVLFRVRCFLFSKAYKQRSFSGDAGLVGCKSSTNFCLWALIFDLFAIFA